LLTVIACAEDALFFKYDEKKTDTYFSEKLSVRSTGSQQLTKAARGTLTGLMKKEVLELASKDWGPWQLLSHPVNQQGNRFTYFNCTDELLVALAAAYPLLDDEGKAAAKQAAERELIKYPPLTMPWRGLKDGEPRGWHDVPEKLRKQESGGPWMSGPEKDVACFRTLYGLWAYADVFGQWDAIKKFWPDIKALKERVAKNYDFKPRFRKDLPAAVAPASVPAGPGILTEAEALSPRYQHRLLHYLLVGTHGFYENDPPRDEAEGSMFKQFCYTKLLSALIAYGRIADRMGEAAEVSWAKERFAFVATQTLSTKTAPFYWSSPWLTPEIARMLRDHAGSYLDQIKARPNIFEGAKKDGFPNDGPWLDVIDAHHCHLAHAGSNGAVPPCSPMSHFLVKALLFQASAERLDDLTDIPWCQADYWYIQKCALTLSVYCGVSWEKLSK
jgi:hypothetical protein